MIQVSTAGEELVPLLAALHGEPAAGGPRRLLGITGAPGAGKTLLAVHLVALAGTGASHVPMDGFHLADVQLERLGLLHRKGAPETFDADGYAALLARLRADGPRTVYAPGFDRALEQPLAGAVAVPRTTRTIVTEGNYLLLADPWWRAVHAQLDEVWHVRVDEELRKERLLARHMRFGKTVGEARHWIATVDEPDARLAESAATGADRVLDLTGWRPPAQ